MNNLNGSPGLTSISASQRAFATKGIIPEFKECKWDYEADKDGFQEFAETFRTVIAARFPEAEIIHRHIDYHTGRQGNLAMVEKVSIPTSLRRADQIYSTRPAVPFPDPSHSSIFPPGTHISPAERSQTSPLSVKHTTSPLTARVACAC